MSKSIWFRAPDIDAIRALLPGTVCDVMGMNITEIGDDFIRGTLPVDSRTFQPLGLVHGGANVVLAETLGSIGANMVIDDAQFHCVGQEVNANHLRGVRKGLITGTATMAYKGKRSQVWQIEIEDERGRLTCLSRLTIAVVKKVES